MEITRLLTENDRRLAGDSVSGAGKQGNRSKQRKRRGGENATSLFTSVVSVSSVSSCKNLPAYWSAGHHRSGSARTVEITCPFRVPLDLPVFVPRCRQSDLALADAVAHGEAVKKSITWPFAPRTSVRALLNSEFSSPVSLGFTGSQRSFAERTATWTPHPRDVFTASERNAN